MLISRTYTVLRRDLDRCLAAGGSSAFARALVDTTWRWRCVYTPLDNARRLDAYRRRLLDWAESAGPLPASRRATAVTLYSTGRGWPRDANWRRPH